MFYSVMSIGVIYIALSTLRWDNNIAVKTQIAKGLHTGQQIFTISLCRPLLQSLSVLVLILSLWLVFLIIPLPKTTHQLHRLTVSYARVLELKSGDKSAHSSNRMCHRVAVTSPDVKLYVTVGALATRIIGCFAGMIKNKKICVYYLHFVCEVESVYVMMPYCIIAVVIK